MRAEVVDKAGSGRGRDVEVQLGAMLARFEAAGHGARRPVQGVLEGLAIPAFTEAQWDRHVLHLRAASVGEAWFPGLLARECAHVALTDLGHPSHDPALLQGAFEAAKARSRDLRFLGAVGALNHHVRDIYAEDLAHEVAPAELAIFVRHLAERAASTEGSGLDVAVEAGYAAATLLRRGAEAPPALRAVLAASEPARKVADALSALHPRPHELADVEQGLGRALAALPDAQE